MDAQDAIDIAEAVYSTEAMEWSGPDENGDFAVLMTGRTPVIVYANGNTDVADSTWEDLLNSSIEGSAP